MLRRTLLALPLAAAAAKPATRFDERLGDLIYETPMDTEASVSGWRMEGKGTVAHHRGWMEMWSPGEQTHHVYWCPQPAPASFAAEWTCRNLHPEAGLCIVFFCATGNDGEDVLDPTLPPRDGTFSQYNKGALDNYHVSYYANTPNTPNRPVARLRKNPGANIVQEGPRGILAASTDIHRVRLLKDSARIEMWVDDRQILDWTDDGAVLGPAYGAGKLALRQMRWTQFAYRDFRLWSLS